MRKARSKKDYEIRGQNIFEDIGVPNADQHLVKAKLVYKIDTVMKKRHMKQTEAAALFGVRQPDISQDAARRVPAVLSGTAAALSREARSGR